MMNEVDHAKQYQGMTVGEFVKARNSRLPGLQLPDLCLGMYAKVLTPKFLASYEDKQIGVMGNRITHFNS